MTSLASNNTGISGIAFRVSIDEFWAAQAVADHVKDLQWGFFPNWLDDNHCHKKNVAILLAYCPQIRYILDKQDGELEYWGFDFNPRLQSN